MAFVDVAVDGVFELFGSEAWCCQISLFLLSRKSSVVRKIGLTGEMVGLTLYRPNTTHLPHELSFDQQFFRHLVPRNLETHPADGLPVLL